MTHRHCHLFPLPTTRIEPHDETRPAPPFRCRCCGLTARPALRSHFTSRDSDKHELTVWRYRQSNEMIAAEGTTGRLCCVAATWAVCHSGRCCRFCHGSSGCSGLASAVHHLDINAAHVHLRAFWTRLRRRPLQSRLPFSQSARLVLFTHSLFDLCSVPFTLQLIPPSFTLPLVALWS